MQAYAKALIPTIVGAILLLLNEIGIMETMTVKELLFYVLTSGVVYLVPNKKPIEA